MLLGDEHAKKTPVADEAPDVLGNVLKLVADAPIVELPAKLDRRPVEKGALFRRERDRGDAAELVPIRRSGEELGIPTDGARFERLALGLGDRGHRAFECAIGGKHEIIALDLGKAGKEQKPGGEPAQQGPKRDDRRVELALSKPHLRAQGEKSNGKRPNAQRGAVHGQGEDRQDGKERENDFSHERPLNVPRPPVPR